MNQPWIIAHRGASAYAPENTMAAFNQAFAFGARWVEFDVMLSEDGKPFVIHDETLSRTTSGTGHVAACTAKKLDTFDAGRWFSKKYSGEKIPHLETVLEWLQLTGVFANIEIKPSSGRTKETTMAVLACLQKHWPKTRPLPLISSFDEEVLFLIREFSPEMPLGLLLSHWTKDFEKTAKVLGCFSIHLPYREVTEERVCMVHASQYKLLVYTVNQVKKAKKLFAMGVDAIFSDYPDLIKP